MNSNGQVSLGLTKADVLSLLEALEGSPEDHLHDGELAVRDKLRARLTRANARLHVPSFWEHENDWGCQY